MAGNATTLIVKILTDASQAQKGTDQAASGYQKFASGVDKLVPAAAAAGAAIVGLGAYAVSSASRTEQAMGALDSVFGKNSAVVKEWASGAAEAVGLSTAEYGEMASTVGASLQNMGLSQDEAADQTKKLIELGADLAATYGGTTSDAVNALSSALRGEADPAERYGLALNATTINAELAADGLDGLTGEAATTARAQAILAKATEDAGGAIGASAREYDTVASATQRAQKQMDNAASTIGTALLPAVAMVAAHLGDMAKWVGENATLVGILVGIVGALAGSILVLSGAMKVYQTVTLAVAAAQKIMAAQTLTTRIGLAALKVQQIAVAAASKVAAAGQWLLNAAMTANPIGLIIAAVVALVAVFVLLWIKSEAFRDFFIGIWEGLADAAVAAWGWITDAAAAAWAWITKAVSTAVNFILALGRAYLNFYITIFTAIGNTAKAVWQGIVAAVQAAWTWIMNLGRTALAVYAGIWRGIVQGALNAWQGVRNAADAVFGWIRGAIGNVYSVVNGVWQSILSAARGVWSQLASVVQGALNSIMGPIYAVQSAFNSIVSAVQDVISWISRIRIPDLSALNPFKAAAAPAAASASFAAMAAPSARAFGASPVLGAQAVSSSRGVGGVTINLNGGLDSADTIARRIEQLLQGRARRQGGVVINRRIV